MVLTFRSSTPETFQLIGTDADGRRRTVTAVKDSGSRYWDITLRHPSGETWPARYSGDAGILDAMAELLNSKDVQFKQDRGRGDRPPPQPYDHSRSLGDADGVPPVVPFKRYFT
ncbi:hypothetical protein ACFQZO_23960 [Bradyrhizobium sp. GCM10027634]|uniref:hypothetical protein n=1 Tax=unclassified Bradyrhizobium TaxID=2631580 RepID=UPI00188B4AD7|nr:MULTISPECIES: hypothetical protein [unclassified Bradyrhizobium]MDN5003896.1 hypothetical protein [Bradyrhizobium sp. WYCCWR 12677]QOZ45442.1 hypothetical protein XH89_19590 [Bradyrhizobium sp. CCBAU 53340]